jgi:hypothetical protein
MDTLPEGTVTFLGDELGTHFRDRVLNQSADETYMPYACDHVDFIGDSV